MNKLLIILLLLLHSTVFSATYTTTSGGDWSAGTIWSSGISAPTSGNNNIINIGVGHNVVLNGNITFGNGCELHIYGSLTINGNLTALNSLVIDVDGSLTINGNVIGNNGASITISGNVSCTGDATFENNGSINMNNGSLDIGGTLTGGTGCEITGTGIINVQGPNNFDSTPAAGVDVNPTLPIELVNFCGFNNGNSVTLKWTTATEIDNDEFEIQRKINNDFVTVGIVKGNGNSNSQILYEYTDKIESNNAEYYQLKQKDYDGNFEFSNVICVYPYNFKNDILVYPNPTLTDLTIEMMYYGIIMKIKLINLNGTEIILGFDKYCDGYAKFLFNIEKIESGIYFVKFETTTETFYYKDKIIII